MTAGRQPSAPPGSTAPLSQPGSAVPLSQPGSAVPPAPPAQLEATVAAAEAFGGYTRLTLRAPGLPAARPGQFVTAAVGGSCSALVLRRAFGIHAVGEPTTRLSAAARRAARGEQVSPGERVAPGEETVSVVVAAAGAGSRWLTERRPGDSIDLIGPLGRGFAEPVADERLVLVGGGYGSAPLAWAAREAAAAGATVHAVLGAATASRLCDVPGVSAATEAAGGSTTVTTDDGSAGEPGRVTGPTERLVRVLLAAGGPVRVAACGPMPMLRAVAGLAGSVAGTDADTGAGSTGRLRVEVSVEEAMACGVGVCMTCVLPVLGSDGRTRMLRACREGAVFDAERVRWDALGPCGSAVPADAVGAPEGGAQ